MSSPDFGKEKVGKIYCLAEMNMIYYPYIGVSHREGGRTMQKRWIAGFLALLMIVGLFACGGNSAVGTPEPVTEATPAPAEVPATDVPASEEPAASGMEPLPDEYFLPKEEGKNQLTVYWKADSINFETSDMWMWFPGGEGKGYPMYPCAYGAKCMINVPADVTEVGFIVRINCSEPGGTSWGEATKVYDGDRFAEMDGDTQIYLVGNEEGIYFSSSVFTITSATSFTEKTT